MIILSRKSVAFILFQNIFTFQKGSHKSHNLDPDQNPLEKIKLVIELKFMEKSAKTVRWVLDKVIFLATCFE